MYVGGKVLSAISLDKLYRITKKFFKDKKCLSAQVVRLVCTLIDYRTCATNYLVNKFAIIKQGRRFDD